jgi:hypothetical protein
MAGPAERYIPTKMASTKMKQSTEDESFVNLNWVSSPLAITSEVEIYIFL